MANLVKKEYDDIKFDKADISAVASNRFFRRAGIKLLLIWAAVTLVITMASNYTHAIPEAVSFCLLAITAIVFVYLYSKKQTEVRVKLWENIEHNRSAKQEEKADNQK